MATLGARFIRALRALEDGNDLQPLAQLYSDESKVQSPILEESLHGCEGAREYWRAYRDSFEIVKTDIHEVVGNDSQAALEWISSAVMLDGTPVEYGGVTLLHEKGGLIDRMRVFFDPRPLYARSRSHK